MPELFVGIDVGSTAIKVLVLDGETDDVVYVGETNYPRLHSKPDWFEIDPDHLFQAVLQGLKNIPDDMKPAITALSLTGQMCGIICLDSDQQALGPCISIFDSRSVEEAAMLESRYSRHLVGHQYNHSIPIYTLPKLLWIKKHQPERFNKTRKILLPKDYIRGRLTGVFVTEHSDASGTLAYDFNSATWDSNLLGNLGIPLDIWPEIVDSQAQTGTLLAEVASITGLPNGLPVFAGAADMAAVILGVTHDIGSDMVISLGTAAHVIVPTNSLCMEIWPIQQYAQAKLSAWYRFGAVFSGGLSLEWYLNTIESPGEYGTYQRYEYDAYTQPLFMPYLSGAGAPHYVPEAAGAFVGLRLSHTKRDLAQAVMAGLAFEIKAVCESLQTGDSGRVYVTGGASQNRPLVEIIANVLGRELFITKSPHAAALGVARLAMNSTYSTNLNRRSRQETYTRVSPDALGETYYKRLESRYRAAAEKVRAIK